jgi:hypothetical protein
MGTAVILPPLVIFKGKTLSKAWLPANTPKDWFFSCNTKGWTSNEHCKKWLAEDFEPYTRDNAEGRPRFLIFDGHGSHTTPDIIRHCIHNRIHLALLPPHTSHLTQPLDVGVFSSLKAQIFSTGNSRMQKAEWLDAFILARAKAFTQRNILSGWRGTGLNPFNPRKVLSRIPIPSAPDTPTREATPEFESPSTSGFDFFPYQYSSSSSGQYGH